MAAPLMAVPLLAIAYVLVAALILNVWIATGWRTGVKVSLVLLVTLLYVSTYVGLREIQGLPAEGEPPERFRLLWAKIEEPDKASRSVGHIYLWVQALDMAQSVVGEPRAYKLPWRLDLAEAVEKATNDAEAGALINGRLTREPIAPAEAGEVAATRQQHREGSETTAGGLRIQLEFTELPRTPLPAKGV